MKIFLLPVAVFLVSALTPVLSAQSAAGPSQCQSNVLSFYDSDSFTTCVIGRVSDGGLDITNFTYAGPQGADGNITVSPDVTASGLGGGFTFGGFLPQAVGSQQTYVIDYTYVIDPGPIGAGMSMTMDPPTGDVVITEDLCIDATFTVSNGTTVCQGPNGGIFNAQTLSVNTATPSNEFGTTALNPVVAEFETANLQFTFVVGGPDAGGAISQFGTLQADTMVVDPAAAPEPLTSALGFGGLLAIGLFRRYRR
jgi:hypothetical protein